MFFTYLKICLPLDGEIYINKMSNRDVGRVQPKTNTNAQPVFELGTSISGEVTELFGLYR